MASQQPAGSITVGPDAVGTLAFESAARAVPTPRRSVRLPYHGLSSAKTAGTKTTATARWVMTRAEESSGSHS